VQPGEENYLYYDVDETAVPRLTIEGDVVSTTCAGPLLFRREYWRFDADPGAAPYDDVTNTWGDGVLVDEQLVAADGVAHFDGGDPQPRYSYSSTVVVPNVTQTIWLGLRYEDHNSAGTIVIQLEPNDSWTFSDWTQDQHC